jgi:hypothetical protein
MWEKHMYVKIRSDGAIGIARGSEGDSEIAIGYGEAHMIAAALEKLAQTARNYKQTYKKTTDVGAGNRIDFERTEAGVITITGDGQRYICEEPEIRDLAKMLKKLPPIETKPASDYVDKIPKHGDYCISVSNNQASLSLTLPEAALVKTSIAASLNGRYYEEHIVGERELRVLRSSNLKWEISAEEASVKFTAYEVEALLNGLNSAILDVIMDNVKSLGSDDIADIRVKSHIQRMEQDTAKALVESKDAKNIVRELTKRTKKILGTSMDADLRMQEFVKMCQYVHKSVDPRHRIPLFNLFSTVFVAGK